MLRLILTATLLPAFACASIDSIVAQPGVSFTLPLGKTAAVSGTTTHLTFRAVTEDSRCPMNAVCVWEGAAKIAITATRNGGPAEAATLSLTEPDNEARLADVVVRFVALAPYPETPGDPATRKYVAELVIRKL